jgi:hypothetical protein
MSNVIEPDEEDPLDKEIVNFEGGVRGKYAARFAEGCNIVKIDLDLTDAFPNEKAVNDALRYLLATGNYPQTPSKQQAS